MATTYKILAQLDSTGAADTLYTVGGSTSAIVSTLSFCNTTGSAATIRVWTVKSAGSSSTLNALYYDLTIAAADTFASTCGITLATGDKINVTTSVAHISCQAFGSEIT